MIGEISARTKVAAVIGRPIGHSMSPAIMNSAFRAVSFDAVYVAFEFGEGAARKAIESMVDCGWLGLNVTMPLKSEVLEHLDRLSPAAETLASVNTVYIDDGELVGDSTDGRGFVAALSRATGGAPLEGKKVVVLGAGGAARSIVHALGEENVASIGIINRTEKSAVAAAELVSSAVVVDESAVPEADIVINATSVGMAETEAAEGLPIAKTLLNEGQIVADIVYNPHETPLLAAATQVGAMPVGGLGMLIHQAALAFELWTKEKAPIEVMRQAAYGTIDKQLIG